MIVSTVFKPNGLPVGSKSKGKLSSRPYSIQFGGKGKCIFRVNVFLYFIKINIFLLVIGSLIFH